MLTKKGSGLTGQPVLTRGLRANRVPTGRTFDYLITFYAYSGIERDQPSANKQELRKKEFRKPPLRAIPEYNICLWVIRQFLKMKLPEHCNHLEIIFCKNR